MDKPIVFMFSGQGSQYHSMGKELYYKNAIFRQWMSYLDRLVSQMSGFSVIPKIYCNSKSEVQEVYGYLATFMMEYSLARVLIENGCKPNYVLGASLGGVTSAALAGSISLEEALQCLVKQAELLEKYCQPGSMIAVSNTLEYYRQSTILLRYGELAALYDSSHFTVSGNCEEALYVEAYLTTGNILFERLPVKYGFHSSNIDPIKEEYKKFLSGLSFKKSNIPMISCWPVSNRKEASPDYFWDVIRRPIYFQQTIEKMEESNSWIYIDVGLSGTLANFVKGIISPDSLSQVHNILNPFPDYGEKMEKLKNAI